MRKTGNPYNISAKAFRQSHNIQDLEQFRFIVGIDPDLHKSGWAIYDRQVKEFVVIKTMTFLDVIKGLLYIDSTAIKHQYLFILEYPDNTNTYHAGGKGAALNVGKNQGAAIILKEMLIQMGCNYKLIAPAGYSKYFKQVLYFQKLTGWIGRTNDDARAAAAMVYYNLK